MGSIFLLLIAVAVATALLGSVIYQFLIPADDVLSPLEQKCQEIANAGYRIHTLYPDSIPDDIPNSDRKRLLYLDEVWMKDCVSALPADSIFSIINNVERNFLHGE